MSAMTVPTEIKLVTGEELLALGDIGPCELIDGRIVYMTPTGGEHGFVEFDLGSELRAFVKQRKLGWVVGGEVGVYLRRNPDRIRGADIAFISKSRLPHKPPKGYLEVAPELIVEVISPNDTWDEVREKLEDYFSIGVERVWVVEPEKSMVLIYRSATEAIRLSDVDILKGEGLLAGFELPLKDLFAE